MRIHFIAGVLACVLFIAAYPAISLEIEAEKKFPATAAETELRIISTADLEIFAPIIEEFQKENPNISVHYIVASSREIFDAVYSDSAGFDLVISSAMDLQTKLVNDGRAAYYNSSQVAELRDWGSWRNQIFAFTNEPAVLLLSASAMHGLHIPENRSELLRLIRDNPERFRGKIGTYDIRTSGLGYLFATQDSRSSEIYWRLTELMGQLGVRLYCCSSDMIKDVESGDLAIAYNVLGSYSKAQINRLKDTIQVVNFSDFSTIMLRTALIPATSNNIEASGRMIDFLLQLDQKPNLLDITGFSPINQNKLLGNESLNTIRLGPNLLVYLDKLKRERFIEAWVSSVEQR